MVKITTGFGEGRGWGGVEGFLAVSVQDYPTPLPPRLCYFHDLTH